MRHATELISIAEVSDLMVVDEDRNFIGVLSEGDVIRAVLPNFDEILSAGGFLSDAFQFFMHKGREAHSAASYRPLDYYRRHHHEAHRSRRHGRRHHGREANPSSSQSLTTASWLGRSPVRTSAAPSSMDGNTREDSAYACVPKPGGLRCFMPKTPIGAMVTKTSASSRSGTASCPAARRSRGCQRATKPGTTWPSSYPISFVASPYVRCSSDARFTGP